MAETAGGSGVLAVPTGGSGSRSSATRRHPGRPRLSRPRGGRRRRRRTAPRTAGAGSVRAPGTHEPHLHLQRRGGAAAAGPAPGRNLRRAAHRRAGDRAHRAHRRLPAGRARGRRGRRHGARRLARPRRGRARRRGRPPALGVRRRPRRASTRSIGVGVGPCHYRVGPEVVTAFARHSDATAPTGAATAPWTSPRSPRGRLLALGVRPGTRSGCSPGAPRARPRTTPSGATARPPDGSGARWS